MAIRGLSMAERQPYILKEDSAHPDTIKEEAKKRCAKLRSHNGESEQYFEELVRKEVGEPTVFFLGNLTHEDKIYLSDLVGSLEQTREGNMRMANRNTYRAFECVRRGLVGWENYMDDSGAIIQFERVPAVTDRGQPRKYVSDDCLNRLHIDIVRELSGEILRLNGVTTELEKKLEGLLQQQSDPHSMDGLALPAGNPKSSEEDAA